MIKFGIGISFECVAVLAVFAFASPSANAQGAKSTISPTAVQPLTGKQFLQLKWIAGKWKGTRPGTTMAPFFERYRFEDDSTLIVDSSPDATFAKLEKPSRYELEISPSALTCSL